MDSNEYRRFLGGIGTLRGTAVQGCGAVCGAELGSPCDPGELLTGWDLEGNHVPQDVEGWLALLGERLGEAVLPWLRSTSLFCLFFGYLGAYLGTK